jgi:hypothetical protein
MRVRLERTGGFANIRRTFTADAATLAPERAEELRRLVEAAALDRVTSRPSAPPRGADRFVYTVTVEQEGTERAVTVGEDAAPAALQQLIDWVQRLAEG